MLLTDRIKSIIKDKNTTFASLERELNLGHGTIRKWDTSSPSSDKILKIAKYFNVSVDWLLTGEQEIYKPNINIETQNSIVKESNLNETIYTDKELSVDEEMLLEAYKNSDRQTKKEILTFITSKTFNCKSLKSKFYNSVNTNEAEDETVAGYELKQLVS